MYLKKRVRSTDFKLFVVLLIVLCNPPTSLSKPNKDWIRLVYTSSTRNLLLLVNKDGKSIGNEVAMMKLLYCWLYRESINIRLIIIRKFKKLLQVPISILRRMVSY